MVRINISLIDNWLGIFFIDNWENEKEIYFWVSEIKEKKNMCNAKE